jgi:hypothetical protein
MKKPAVAAAFVGLAAAALATGVGVRDARA